LKKGYKNFFYTLLNLFSSARSVFVYFFLGALLDFGGFSVGFLRDGSILASAATKADISSPFYGSD